MTAITVRGNRSFLAVILVLLSIFLSVVKVPAKIPEPANVIYGNAGGVGGTITLKVDGQVISSYTMGSIPDAGDLYVLTVPIDALDPQTPGTARPGDIAEIYLDNVPMGTMDIIEKGSVRKFDLAGIDTDLDEMPDIWEQQIIDADSGDDITTNDDVLPEDDFDHDGDKNLAEYENGTDPTDALSTTKGDLDEDKTITLSDAIIALQIACGMDIGPVSISGDINGDDSIGIPEAVHALRRLSASSGQPAKAA